MYCPGALARKALRTSSSFAKPWYSELCHLNTMWMMLLMTNTSTADSTIGIQSCSMEIIWFSLVVVALMYSVVHRLATDHGHDRLDIRNLVHGHGQIVAIEHHEIGVLARRERAEVRFLEHEVGVRS